MKNDFVTLFEILETSEKTGFEDYIFYFYKQQKAVLNTFKDIAKTMVEKDDNQLIELIKKNKKTLNDLSDLKKWLIEFITIQEIKNDTYEAKFLTLEALRKRKMTTVLTKKTTELRSELARNKARSNVQNLMKMGLDHAAYFNTENDKLATDSKVNIEQLMDGLDNFYVENKLKYSTELQNRTDILKEQYKPKLLSEILRLIAADDAALKPIIHALHLPLFQLITDKSETAYHQVKAFLWADEALNAVEKLSILLNLLNFSAYKVRKGDKTYFDAFLQLTQFGLDKSLFIAAGYFPPRTFNNIVNMGCYLEAYAWTSGFIDTWSAYLNPEDRFIIHNLASARLHFAEKNFAVAIDLLMKLARHKNVHFAIEIRTLLARSYYERGVETFPKNHCAALELYIQRTVNINDGLKESVLNFIKILHALVNTKKPKKQLLEELNGLLKDKSVMYSDWLRTKIEARNA